MAMLELRLHAAATEAVLARHRPVALDAGDHRVEQRARLGCVAAGQALHRIDLLAVPVADEYCLGADARRPWYRQAGAAAGVSVTRMSPVGLEH